MSLRRPVSYKKFDICQLSSPSVNNTHSVCDFVTTNDLDILAISETLLGRGTLISQLHPHNYNILHVLRKNGASGGGLGMGYKITFHLRNTLNLKYIHILNILNGVLQLVKLFSTVCCVSTAPIRYKSTEALYII